LRKFILNTKGRKPIEGVPLPLGLPKAPSNELRSGSERTLREWLTKYFIKFDYEPFAIRLAEGDRYVPDFYLPEHYLALECKGYWGIGVKEKMRRVLDEGHSVLVVPDYLVRKLKSDL